MTQGMRFKINCIYNTQFKNYNFSVIPSPHCPLPTPEGITGTTIKDTWTKSRGRVEVGEGGGFSWGGVEGWGEKADNCN